MSSCFWFRVSVPRRISIGGNPVGRETFYSWVWKQFERKGFLGVDEGTCLATEVSVDEPLDSAAAPPDRDWIGAREKVEARLFFSSRDGASHALYVLGAISGIDIGAIEEQEEQDWNAESRKHFAGVKVEPFWNVIPAWLAHDSAKNGQLTTIEITPGAGFGTGTHETTRLCLNALGERKSFLSGKSVLDFGSGSGILSIASALCGASVSAVEIDPLAVDNARGNAKLNRVESEIEFFESLEGAPGSFDVVVANILKSVLIEYSDALASRLKPGGALILSGLLEADIQAVVERFNGLLADRGFVSEPVIEGLGEWRLVAWN